MSEQKSRLGRGLGGLISHGISPSGKSAVNTVEVASRLQSIQTGQIQGDTDKGFPIGEYMEIPVARISPNPYQPRKSIEQESLDGLAESIREQGLLQPIVVRKTGSEAFELIAGERRLRAFERLKLSSIPARIIEANDAKSASLALIENLQREGLNPIEEALGYASLVRDFDLTQEKAAERIGKNRASFANALRLLRLPADIQSWIAQGLISTGHAKVILGLESKEEQQAFARKMLEQGWSVREAERKIKSFHLSGSKQGAKSVREQSDPAVHTALKHLEKKVSTRLSAEAQLRHKGKKGQLIIHYRGLDDLQRIMEAIGVSPD